MEKFERGELPEGYGEKQKYRFWRVLGEHKETWSAYVPNRAEFVETVYDHMEQQMLDRGWDDLSVYRTGIILEKNKKHNINKKHRLEVQEHLLCERIVDGKANLAIGLRVAQKAGKDMEITWREYQRKSDHNLLKGGTVLNIFLAILEIAVGIPFILASGAGLAAIGHGFYWIGVSLRLFIRTKDIPSEYNLESKSYIEAFEYCLMAALEETGIYKNELRILEDTVKGRMANIDNQ